jgi:TATA-box binding protein (TBP) (component of TFIID and TFIIIB)
MCRVSVPVLRNVVGHFRVAPNPLVIKTQWQDMVLQCWREEEERVQERSERWKTWRMQRPVGTRLDMEVDSETFIVDDGRWPKGKKGGKKNREQEHALDRVPRMTVAHKPRRNFVVFHLTMDNATPSFTLFPRSGDVIVTGMKSVSMLSECARRFCALTDTSLVDVSTELKALMTPRDDTWEYRKRNTSVVQPWVTNMTFSGVIGCRSVRRVKRQTAVMEAIAKFSESHKHPNFSISMRSTFFPGAYLKHAKMRGVINVFRNGSYVIVGVRSQEEANELRDWLDVIMKEYWMTLKRGSPCACFVDSSSATASAAAVERELLEEFGLAESGPATEGQIGETKEEAEEEEVVVDEFLELDEVTETDVLKDELPQTRVGKVMVATEMGRTQYGICGTSRRQEWLKTPYSTKYYDY